MDSEGIIKLPVIDFSSPDLKPGTPIWDTVKHQVRKALEEFGCFEALFDKFPDEIRKSIFEGMAQVFDLPTETKIKNSTGKRLNGYIGPEKYPDIPLYEGTGVEEPTLFQNIENFTQLMWPQGNSTFSKTMHFYSEQLSELDKTVRKMVIESLGLQKYLDEHMDSTYRLLRFLKYKGPQTNDTKIGIFPHTDMGIVSTLHQNQVKGLEVQTKDGHWIQINFSTPHSFVVMIGDSLRGWTNGRLHAPYHRVMMSGNESRYSTAFFSIPKDEYIIKVAEELVDEEHPLLFKPFDYLGFITFKTSEIPQEGQDSLKAYCGISQE